MKPYILDMEGTVGGIPIQSLTDWIGGKYKPYKGREGIYIRRYETIDGVVYLWSRFGYKVNTTFSLKPGSINWAFIYDGGRYWFLPGNNIDEAMNHTLVDQQQHLAWRGIQNVRHS